ncbi:hypothetical protein CIB93_18685 [Streptomyces sp. WZ.A104]|uniref:hypothetical protein n=1 Tax=Streptomyces sp. WZ.A104 TaxID=2023771 RepID=UPI000BBC0C30|nr:hypothetical protein [Streptomyces sp. WZ.A104]PCG84560.1 hypothetical protein CIB93_18685 [Streptomyces sp. WZ.A104]
MTTARSPQRADGRTAAVRQRLGLGRLLPLGGPADGAWIVETAAASVLRGAAAVPGTVLGKLRIGSAEEREGEGAPPAPANALPSRRLRIEAEFSAVVDRPLPDAAAALREVLITAAAARLGLEIAEVDLRVTALFDEDAPDQVTAAAPAAPLTEADGPVAAAAARAPGVVSLTRALGRAVHTARDHVRIEVATAADRRALDVARSVRTAVAAALEDRQLVTVVVTDVVEPGPGS